MALLRALGKLTVAATALALAAPTAASAKEFHLYGCRDAIGAPAPMDGWTFGTNNGIDPGFSPGYVWGPDNAILRDECAAGGHVDILHGDQSGRSPGSVETNTGYGFRPQDGVTLKRAVLRRFLAAYPSYASPATAVANIRTPTIGAFGKGTEVEHMQNSYVGDPMNAAAAANRLELTALDGKALVVGTTCVGQRRGYAADCNLSATLWSSDLVLDDVTPPTGALQGDAIGGTKVGAVTFEARANDVGVGVMSALVEVDGKVVAKTETRSLGTAPSCVPTAAPDGLRSYTVRQPCPATTALAVTWDSGGVANGTHDVRVLIEDASGNQSAVATGKLTTNNPVKTPAPGTTSPGGAPTDLPRIGPGTPLAERGAANGDGADDAGTLSLVWPTTAKAPSSKPAVQRRCRQQPTWAAKHPAQCQGVAARSSLEVGWSTVKTDEVRGRLATAAGTPVRGATVVLTLTPTMAGALPTSLGTVTTGDDGGFSVKVPRTHGSATIEAQWMARLNDTVPAAASTATTAVRGKVTLAPLAPVRAGSRVTFRGTIPTLGLPGDGRRIALQYLRGSAWTTFAEPRVAANGKWSYARLFRGRGNTYRIRVLMRELPGLPFATSSSAPRSLEIR
ncbi:MAG: hypothetical protein PGN13_13155 [Patulibacter minatonensis]